MLSLDALVLDSALGENEGVPKDRTNLCQLIRSGGGEVAEKPGEKVVHILPHTAPRHAFGLSS